jgi:hypothetical protein
MVRNRNLGSVGAIGKAKMKSLHLSQSLPEKYGTSYDCKYLDGLKIFCVDKGKVSRKGRVVDQYIVHHPNFGEEEFMVAMQMCTVFLEGGTPFDDKVVVIPIFPPWKLNRLHKNKLQHSQV